MTAPRYSDWETRLSAYLEKALADVRKGRRHYCALFATGAVKAMTGWEATEPYRGKYADVAKNLETTFDANFAEKPAALAIRGDLAFSDGSVGVVIGADALFVGENEHGEPDLVRVPRRDWVKAWGVGNA